MLRPVVVAVAVMLALGACEKDEDVTMEKMEGFPFLVAPQGQVTAVGVATDDRVFFIEVPEDQRESFGYTLKNAATPAPADQSEAPASSSRFTTLSSGDQCQPPDPPGSPCRLCMTSGGGCYIECCIGSFCPKFDCP